MNEGPTILAVGVAVVTLVVPLAIVHGLYRLQETSEAWRKLADRHRLHFDPGRRVSNRTTVSGLLSGRDFLLKRSNGNKNNNAVYMELSLTGSLPAGLELHPADQNAARSEASIDDQLRATADDPEDVATYLTPQRTRAALQLAGIGGSLEDRKLRVQTTHAVIDLEELDSTLHVLLQTAPILDSSHS